MKQGNKISFTINACNHYGNNKFNPPGKPSDTNPKRWTKEIRERLDKYHDWQYKVREVFAGVYIAEQSRTPKPAPFSLTWERKIAYNKNQKFKLTIMIYFMNDRRSDGANVYKGIEDSIFENDRNCIGNFDFTYDKKNPRVEISLEIY